VEIITLFIEVPVFVAPFLAAVPLFDQISKIHSFPDVSTFECSAAGKSLMTPRAG
jgi:hypothetical protein